MLSVFINIIVAWNDCIRANVLLLRNYELIFEIEHLRYLASYQSFIGQILFPICLHCESGEKWDG